MLGLVLLIAAVFRLNGFDWDSGTHQHPDERFLTDVASRVRLPASLAEYFATARSPLNPYAQGQDRYAYGQLPLTLTRAAAERVGMTGFDSVYLVGRALSALASLGTIGVTWLLARRILGRRHAHLAALLLAVTVLDIQLAHFLTVDTFVAFFAAAGVYFGQRAWQRESLVDAALAGAMAGLAAASKISALTLLPALFAAFLWPRSSRWSRDQLLDGLTLFGVAVLAAFAAFRVAEPYAFLGPGAWNVRLNLQWVADKAYWAEVSSGAVDVPYMIQWAGTPAYLFSIQALVQWGMGPALGVAALAGLGLASWRLVRGSAGERELLLVVAWTALNLAYFGGQFAKFLRYLLPIYFALAILAAYALLQLVDWARARPALTAGSVHRGAGWRGPARGFALGLPLAVVAATAGWALAFSQVYAQPHSRIQASRWIYTNVPAGSTLAVEHWDDRLPLSLPEGDGRQYRYVELALYDPESRAKRESLLAALDQADYVVLASRRLADSIPRLPERYPLATAYYRLLESGQLGFQRALRVRVLPSLGPLTIDDSRAQEDFTVYDHPTVEVWAKTPDYSSDRARRLLEAIPVESAVPVRPADGGKGALLLTAQERQAVEAGSAWSALFDPTSLANRPLVRVLVWLLAMEGLAVAAVPLLWRTLRHLPDRGYGASKILGLALVSYAVWLAASLRVAPFGRSAILAAALGLAGLSVGAVWRERRAYLTWLRAEWRLVAAIESVYLAGFGLFLFIRAANPDLWHPVFGGEKPMNFAFLNAVIRSDYFPPYDPWFAGGIINYYYFGQVLVAVPTKLTGILPEVAFNLAQPSLYGAVGAGVFGTAFSLALPRAGRAARRVGYLAGVSAVVLVALFGNLDGGLQVLDQLWRLGGQSSPDAGGLARLGAGVLAVAQGQRFPPLDFWRSTRLIQPEDPVPITEFPYFTFLYGDLHAQQIALPLAAASVAVALNALRAARRAPDRVPWPSVAWAALLVGMLRVTNTWDMPTYGGLAAVALGLGFLPGLVRLRRGSLQALAASLVVLAAGSQALFWPYAQRYQLFYTGVEPIEAKTALSQYLTIYGLPLFLAGSLLAWYGVRAWRRRAAVERRRTLVEAPGGVGVRSVSGVRVRGPGAWALPGSDCAGAQPAGFAGPPGGRAAPLVTPAGVVALLGGAVALGLLVLGYPTSSLIVLGGAAAGAASLGLWRRASRSFQAALVAVALLVTLVPEFVALEGDIGRMNTVFKLSYQAWLLLGLAAAVAFAWLVAGLEVRPKRPNFLRQTRPRALRAAWLAGAALLAAAALSYPLFATEGKLSQRFADLPLTLDGMAYMDVARYLDRGQDLDLPADAAAIRWLRANVQGSPTILEGRAPIYRWGSRVAIYTGLPTVLGWDWHEQQQRAGYVAMIQERAADVQRAYDSPDPAVVLGVLRKYGVRWVYVGGLERAYYSAAGLSKFQGMAELRLAYDVGGVQIYEVLT